jgi:hypothetical protein
MNLLHAKTNDEIDKVIKFYGIRIYKSDNKLDDEVVHNLLCKEVLDIVLLFFFQSYRDRTFGSAYYCCDYVQIQSIIADNRALWGGVEHCAGAFADTAALERRLADTLEEKKKLAKQYTAAAGREGRLTKELEETESHMAILVELAAKVTKEFSPPMKITKDAIKAKYLALGKIRGVEKVPSDYVEIFRQNMPQDIINWGGAPSQGLEKYKT